MFNVFIVVSRMLALMIYNHSEQLPKDGTELYFEERLEFELSKPAGPQSPAKDT